jgi:hypothetical protein
MIGKYTAIELRPNFENPGEDIRLHTILTDLFQRAKDNLVLAEVEKEFICTFLKTAEGDVPPFDVSAVCASFNFKYLYLTYGYDLTGGSKYYKPYGLEVKEIPIHEAIAELDYLRDEAKDWEKKLADKANADALMLETIREYEFELKQVQENSPEFKSKFQFGGYRKYQHDLFATQLQNKFVYLTAKEVFESFNNQQLTLTLNGKSIVINEFSIVHITNRHFAETIKRYPSKKSFHNENFHPKLLNTQLQTIFQQIEQVGGLNAASVKELHFQYRGDIYKVYTTDRANYTGNIFLSTFFVVNDPAMLTRLGDDYNLIGINGELSVFQPK